jgi:hypothetical protein
MARTYAAVDAHAGAYVQCFHYAYVCVCTHIGGEDGVDVCCSWCACGSVCPVFPGTQCTWFTSTTRYLLLYTALLQLCCSSVAAGLLVQSVTYFYIQSCCSSVAALLQLVYWYKALRALRVHTELLQLCCSSVAVGLLVQSVFCFTSTNRAVAALLQLCCSWFASAKRFVLYEYKQSCCSSVAALLQLVC